MAAPAPPPPSAASAGEAGDAAAAGGGGGGKKQKMKVSFPSANSIEVVLKTPAGSQKSSSSSPSPPPSPSSPSSLRISGPIEQAACDSIGYIDDEVLSHFRRDTFTRRLAKDAGSASSFKLKKVSPEADKQYHLEQKLAAAAFFKDKKAGYRSSISVPLTSNRIESIQAAADCMSAYTFAKTGSDREILYRAVVHKFDRSSLKQGKDEVIIITNASVIIMAHPKIKLKVRIPLDDIVEVLASKLKDGILVINTIPSTDDSQDKGNYIYESTHLFELVAVLFNAVRARSLPSMKVRCVDAIELQSLNARIVFAEGGKAGYSVSKEGKTKVLTVTCI